MPSRTRKGSTSVLKRRDLYKAISDNWDTASITASPLVIKVFRIIMKLMIDSLQRGEDVKIRGLGTFYVDVQPARERQIGVFDKPQGKLLFMEPVSVPAKKVVKFAPVLDLRNIPCTSPQTRSHEQS